MTKKQAISIITKCAKQYRQFLENKHVAFVYRDENNHCLSWTYSDKRLLCAEQYIK